MSTPLLNKYGFPTEPERVTPLHALSPKSGNNRSVPDSDNPASQKKRHPIISNKDTQRHATRCTMVPMYSKRDRGGHHSIQCQRRVSDDQRDATAPNKYSTHHPATSSDKVATLTFVANDGPSPLAQGYHRPQTSLPHGSRQTSVKVSTPLWTSLYHDRNNARHYRSQVPHSCSLERAPNRDERQAQRHDPRASGDDVITQSGTTDDALRSPASPFASRTATVPTSPAIRYSRSREGADGEATTKTYSEGRTRSRYPPIGNRYKSHELSPRPLQGGDAQRVHYQQSAVQVGDSRQQVHLYHKEPALAETGRYRPSRSSKRVTFQSSLDRHSYPHDSVHPTQYESNQRPPRIQVGTHQDAVRPSCVEKDLPAPPIDHSPRVETSEPNTTRDYTRQRHPYSHGSTGQPKAQRRSPANEMIQDPSYHVQRVDQPLNETQGPRLSEPPYDKHTTSRFPRTGSRQKTLDTPRETQDEASRVPRTLDEPKTQVNGDDMEQEMVCPICMSIMAAVHAVAPCGHTLCGGCGYEWLREHDKCPICRAAITIEPPCAALVPLLPMDRLIEVWVRAKGSTWDGLEGFNDRKSAWEAQKIVIREEEQATAARRTEAHQTPSPTPFVPSDPLFSLFDGFFGGEDEYRLRDHEPVIASQEYHTSSFSDIHTTTPLMPGRASLGHGSPFHPSRPVHHPRAPPLGRSVSGFETLEFPEHGVNPIMDAFGYSRPPDRSSSSPRPPPPPPAHRSFSLPGRTRTHGPSSTRDHNSPFAWISDVMGLVDTFTRHHVHHQPPLGAHSGYSTGRDHGSSPLGQWTRGNEGQHRPGQQDLTGLEDGMARLFAELRRARGS